MIIAPILYEKTKVDAMSHLPLGAYVVYEDEDMSDLEHFLDFCRDYFQITHRSRMKRAHPFVQLDDVQVSLPSLIRAFSQIRDTGITVAIGFYYPEDSRDKWKKDVQAFHSYKAHLDNEKTLISEEAHDAYAHAEQTYFPVGKQLN